MLGILWIIGSEIKLMGNKTCKYLYVFVCLKASQFCTSVVMAHRHFKCLIFSNYWSATPIILTPSNLTSMESISGKTALTSKNIGNVE